MPRADISKYLVHWTKGSDYQAVFDVFREIVHNRKLIGSGDLIKGGYCCVCFTEAPENSFHQVLGKYKPFGIQAPKDWLFSLGGRPVIYETDHEYYKLPEEIKWRHMKYEPDANPPFDFSWEREWRIQVEELELTPEHTRLLVPHESWAQALIEEHNENEYEELHLMASVYGEEYLGAPIEEFSFNYSVISV